MTKKTNTIPTMLIAPCGMNCRLCRAFVRERNACPGCRGDDSHKLESRAACRIKSCVKTIRDKAGYCFSCDSFPCPRLRNLDKRYRTKYGMSTIDNLEALRSFGIRRFISREKEKWCCTGCGGMICVHEPQCISCGYRWR